MTRADPIDSAAVSYQRSAAPVEGTDRATDSIAGFRSSAATVPLRPDSLRGEARDDAGAAHNIEHVSGADPPHALP